MKRWYPIVYATGSVNDADLMKALDAQEAYSEEYRQAKKDLNVFGKIEHVAADMGGTTEHRFAQLQDLEAILEYLEGRERKAMVDRTRHYLEHYQRTLSDRIAREYAEVSDEVQLIRSVKERVGAVRNLYLGIMKGLASLDFAITNVTKLKCAGMEDAEISTRREY